MAALVFGLAAGLQAEAQPARGELVERVACRRDPTQTYTLYLPSTYTDDHAWPLVLVLDPRGRGTLAAEIFKDAAEAYGWIVASSDNTLSDGPWEPNQRALEAMWPDVHERYAVDPKRIYAAGFSGTVAVAWALARATHQVAGIIASGGRLDAEVRDLPLDLAFFNAAGTRDFNHLEAIDIDRAIERNGRPHRFEEFDGAHQWLPPALAAEAVGWLETLAMKDGHRPADPALVERLLASEVEAARGLEAERRPLDALQRYRTAATTFQGLADVTGVEARIAALDDDRAVNDARMAETRIERLERAEIARLSGALVELFAPGSRIMAGEAARALDLDGLADRAAKDTPEGGAARRLLELVFVQTAFYLPRDRSDARDFLGAATALTIATQIHPERARVWYDLAVAWARARRTREALDALEQAVARGFGDRATLASEEAFAPLRDTERFKALVGRLPPDVWPPPIPP